MLQVNCHAAGYLKGRRKDTFCGVIPKGGKTRFIGELSMRANETKYCSHQEQHQYEHIGEAAVKGVTSIREEWAQGAAESYHDCDSCQLVSLAKAKLHICEDPDHLICSSPVPNALC